MAYLWLDYNPPQSLVQVMKVRMRVEGPAVVLAHSGFPGFRGRVLGLGLSGVGTSARLSLGLRVPFSYQVSEMAVAEERSAVVPFRIM